MQLLNLSVLTYSLPSPIITKMTIIINSTAGVNLVVELKYHDDDDIFLNAIPIDNVILLVSS